MLEVIITGPQGPSQEQPQRRTSMIDPNQILVSDVPTFKDQIKAECDLFGNEGIMIEFQQDDRIPNRWIRFWSKVFFNSKWTLMDDNERNNQKVRT